MTDNAIPNTANTITENKVTEDKTAGDIVIRGGLDRLRYILMFEAILVACSTVVIAFILQRDLLEIGYFALIISSIAMLINYFYNYAYDYYDVSKGRVPTERVIKQRIYHALGFELILLIVTLPIVMWWLELDLINALIFDIGMMAAVVVYTFIFALCYDRAFPIKQPKNLIINNNKQ